MRLRDRSRVWVHYSGWRPLALAGARCAAGGARAYHGATAIRRPVRTKTMTAIPAFRSFVCCRPLAAGLAVLALGACVAASPAIQFQVQDFGTQYVRRQIVASMEAAGYRQVYFTSFRTRGDTVREVRTAATDEMRFARQGTRTFVAKTYFDKPQNTVSVRLVDGDGRPLGAGEEQQERERLLESLRATFGPHAVR